MADDLPKSGVRSRRQLVGTHGFPRRSTRKSYQRSRQKAQVAGQQAAYTRATAAPGSTSPRSSWGRSVFLVNTTLVARYSESLKLYPEFGLQLVSSRLGEPHD
eukprot:scaffold133_cov407-Prasinococcus_capsulatus_cf.AAC.17